MATVKRAEKAGSWYPAEPEELRREIDDCLLLAESRHGRAAVSPGCKPTAAVTPHAGLFFSGAVAATAFRLILDAWGEVDTFVIFGACHRAPLREPGVWAAGRWETPLGDIEVDADLAERFIAGGVGRENPDVHLGDNAIELQTPFIKHLFPRAKILPIAMSTSPDGWRRGVDASRLVRGSDGVVVAVASTDLTHYGSSFDLMPAGTGEAAVAWTRENDARFLDALVSLDVERIAEVGGKDRSACGAGAAAAAAGWARDRGCLSGRVLARTNSYEIMPRGEADHLVGYAAVAFDAATD